MSPTLTERERYDMRDTPEREISLGTSTILGIFFALALVCAVFFGLGYTMGRKSVPAAAALSTVASSPGNEAFKSFKPAPGNPTPAPKEASPQDVPRASKTEVAPAPEPVTKPRFDPDAAIVTSTGPAAPAKPSAPPVRPPATQPGASGSAIVQVSAFRRQEDADTVASALRKKGYTVYIRQEPQDSYLHVQLGPYATKKDAEAMKDRLSADGFNAIVK